MILADLRQLASLWFLDSLADLTRIRNSAYTITTWALKSVLYIIALYAMGQSNLNHQHMLMNGLKRR
jgi:hypothetical protein